MKADKEEAMHQIRGVLWRSKKLIAEAKTEEDRAAGLAMCEGYLQAFYFCGVITREEYSAFQEGLETFRRLEACRREAERRKAG